MVAKVCLEAADFTVRLTHWGYLAFSVEYYTIVGMLRNSLTM